MQRNGQNAIKNKSKGETTGGNKNLSALRQGGYERVVANLGQIVLFTLFIT
jgi:hypothetical protein